MAMWEILTGEEPYANMHCGAIIGKFRAIAEINVLFFIICFVFILSQYSTYYEFHSAYGIPLY